MDGCRKAERLLQVSCQLGGRETARREAGKAAPQHQTLQALHNLRLNDVTLIVVPRISAGRTNRTAHHGEYMRHRGAAPAMLELSWQGNICTCVLRFSVSYYSTTISVLQATSASLHEPRASQPAATLRCSLPRLPPQSLVAAWCREAPP